MTTIVTRLYASAETAKRVAEILRADGFPEATISVITQADTSAMREARVDDRAAAQYAKAMTGDAALFVCRAPFTPFGAARRAQEVADGEDWIDAGVSNQNLYVREKANLEKHTSSVIQYHPLMMTRDDYVGSGWSDWRLSDVFGFTTVSRRRARPDNLIRGHMSRAFWPGKILSSKSRGSSVIPGGRLFLSSARSVSAPKKHSIMKGHPRISERFGWATIKTSA